MLFVQHANAEIDLKGRRRWSNPPEIRDLWVVHRGSAEWWDTPTGSAAAPPGHQRPDAVSVEGHGGGASVPHRHSGEPRRSCPSSSCSGWLERTAGWNERLGQESFNSATERIREKIRATAAATRSRRRGRAPMERRKHGTTRYGTGLASSPALVSPVSAGGECDVTKGVRESNYSLLTLFFFAAYYHCTQE